MIYTLIILILKEKPFYLLRPQSFSFQIVSEFKDTFVKFSNFMSWGWGFLTPCSVPRGGFLYTLIVPGGGFLLPSSCVLGACPRGMVLDEIDTCIMEQLLLFFILTCTSHLTSVLFLFSSGRQTTSVYFVGVSF